MQKKLLRENNVQLPAGQAKPGKELAFLGKNAMKFCQEFNQKTKELESWKILITEVKVYEDGSYEFTPPRRSTVDLIRRAGGEEKILTEDKLWKIVEEQFPYSNTDDIEKFKKSLIGVAKTLRVKITKNE